MKHIVYNFHKSNNPFSKGIRLVTRTQRFNHVSIELGNRTYEAKFNPFVGFHSFKGIYDGVFSYKEWLKNDLKQVHKVKVSITDAQYDKIQSLLDSYDGVRQYNILKWKITLPKTGYDYLSMYGFLENKDTQKDNSLYCSEIGNKTFELITEQKLTRKTNLSPDDFYLMVLYFNIGRGSR